MVDIGEVFKGRCLWFDFYCLSVGCLTYLEGGCVRVISDNLYYSRINFRSELRWAECLLLVILWCRANTCYPSHPIVGMMQTEC